ncbi:MAG: PilZ domain-containing protein [Myxococcota bacterium]
MPNRPRVLLLDDGELAPVERMLRKMDVECQRLTGSEIGRRVAGPTDLLITAGRRTLNAMPEIELDPDAQAPVWVCIHGQDFLPMRERLREMGVHYLLQNALDEDSRRRFVRELLRVGAERRSTPRLPVGGEVEYGLERPQHSGRLVELAVDGCRILTQERVAPGEVMVVRLPAALADGRALELGGRVVREPEPTLHAGHAVHATPIRFEALDETRRALLESAIRGERIGTRLTVLAARPEPAAPPAPHEAPPPAYEATETDGGEVDDRDVYRLRAARHAYDRPVQVLGADGAWLGCDLSLTGLRIEGGAGLEDDARVTVALYGASREEPVVVAARVVRGHDGGGVALTFEALGPTEAAGLRRLLERAPALDALDRPDPAAGRMVVAELRDAARA